jgi:16S rRNA (guanine527-N7)-methyltransferase
MDHLRLLLAWSVAVNLTAITDPVVAVRRHVLDSLAATPLLRERRIDAFVDIGSGGGYPGLPLAVTVPARRALLVDSVGKKARFLEAAATVTGLADSVQVFAGRAERLAGDGRHRERWPAVVARAVGDLAEVAELGLPLLARGGILVAWKRGDLRTELDLNYCCGYFRGKVEAGARYWCGSCLRRVGVRRVHSKNGAPRRSYGSCALSESS